MRHLTNQERDALTCKPGDLTEAGRVAMSDERLREIADKALRLEFVGGLRGLDAAIENARKNGYDMVELLAVDVRTGSVYAVNTEGYDYARYIGRVR